MAPSNCEALNRVPAQVLCLYYLVRFSITCKVAIIILVYQWLNRGSGAITCSLVVQHPLTLPDFHLRNHFFACSLLSPERELHSPWPWVALWARPVTCLLLDSGWVPRAMEILLLRVCPDKSIPVCTTLLWPGFHSQEAMPVLASPASS